MSSALIGKRILIVEDEFLIADDVARSLKAMGAVVLGPVKTVADGLLAILMGVDAAILDVRLADGEVYRVADELRRRGKPFLFLSGTDPENVPERFDDAPFVSKPCSDATLAAALRRLFDPVDHGEARSAC